MNVNKILTTKLVISSSQFVLISGSNSPLEVVK